MVSEYLEYSEEKLSESRRNFLKCFKLLVARSESLSNQQIIIELLKILKEKSSIQVGSYQNSLVMIQDLTNNLESIRQFWAISEEELKNQLNNLELDKRKIRKSREDCDNILKILGDGVDFYVKILSAPGFYSTTDEKLNPTHLPQKDFSAKIDEYIRLEELVRKMSEEPKQVINTTNYFKKGRHNHNHNYQEDKNLKEQVTELRQLVIQLQQEHQPTTEAEAITVIDAEFSEIQETDLSRWQVLQEQLKLLQDQILNPERHLAAAKETVSEIAKHYLEESVVGKALITYLKTMSADPSQGQ
ncbi:MAG: hypothetical protein HC941_02530 [Microcoleus sp. SU_5_3]|nr:hypothetical protein [Microcoleus sp. SU_5_3]